MTQSKELRFKFVADEQSAQRVNKILDDMIRRAQDLAKTLHGIGGIGGGGLLGGGSVGGTSSPQRTMASAATNATTQKVSFAGILGQNLEVMRRTAAEGGSAMKAMSDALKKGVTEQSAQVKKLSNELNDLSKMYDKVAAKGNEAFNQKLQSLIISKQSQIQNARKELSDLRQVQGDFEPHLGPRDDLSVGVPGKQRWWNRLYSPQGGSGLIQGIIPTRMGGMLGGIGGAAAGLIGAANFGLNESLAGNRAYASAEARRGELVESRIRQMHAGDTRWLFSLGQIQRDSDAKKDLQAQTSGIAANAEQIRNGVGQAVGSVPVIGAIGRALGLVGADQGGGALGGFTTAAQQSGMAENAFKQMDEKMKGTAMLYANMAQESFQRRLGTSIQLQRVMGLGGLQRDPRTGQWTSQANDLMTNLEGQGYDAGQYMSAFQGLRNQAGNRAGGRNAWLSMAANAQGYGGFGELLAASARVGQGNTLALGALGGGIDKAAGIQLGLGMLGQGFDPMGTTTGYGALAAAQAGMGFTGAATDFNKVQQAVLGLQAGSSVTTGALDPYQQGRNLVGAIGINPSGSTYSQDFLANGMSMKQMLDMANGGKLTETAKAYGLDQGQIRAQLSESMGSVFDRWVDEKKNDPLSKAIRGFQKSGKGTLDYLADLRKSGSTDELNALGVAFGQLTGQGEEAGIGAIKTASGSGESLKSGKIGGGVGGVEKSALESQKKLQEQVDTTLKIIGESLQATYKAMPEATKTLSSFGQNLSAEADTMMKALGELTEAFKNATAKISGQPPASTWTTATPKKK